MNGKFKVFLMAVFLFASTWLIFREQRPDPAPPKKEPTYAVMGKRFIYGPSQSYYIEYELIGPGGDIVAQCVNPREDSTGCERFKTMQTYVLTKDKTERFLDSSDGVRLRIKSEGWSDKNEEHQGDFE
jgi:hypothetical protein